MTARTARQQSRAVFEKIWTDYKTSLGGRTYTPLSNHILEIRILDSRLTPDERLDAWLMRRSAGNWCAWACQRDSNWGEAIPLRKRHAAEETGLTVRRVSTWAKRRESQGYLRIGDGTTPDLLILNLFPTQRAKKAGSN